MRVINRPFIGVLRNRLVVWRERNHHGNVVAKVHSKLFSARSLRSNKRLLQITLS